MKLYRVQVVDRDMTRWFPTRDEAKKERTALKKLGMNCRIDAVNVGTYKESLVFAMNHASANFTVFPGEEVR